MRILGIAAIAALVSFSAPAFAQAPCVIDGSCGYSRIIPIPVTGFGRVAVTTASVSLATATLGPNSSAWPAKNLPNRQFTVKNAVTSSGNLWVCPLGGTCAATNGIALAPGESQTWNVEGNVTTTPPTAISESTSIALVTW